VNREILTALATANVGIAAIHHLSLILGAVFLWMRRDLARTPSVLLAAAFVTTAWVMLPHAGARVGGVVAAALALFWIIEVVRPDSTLSFVGTERTRLLVSLAAFVYALFYPGYETGLPLALAAPVGVLLPPTVLAALSVLNGAAPRVRPSSHWAHIGAGLAFGIWGIALGQWFHAPLAAFAAYGAVLRLRGTTRLEEGGEPEGSVRSIRDRMFARKTLLQRPRKYVRRIKVRRRDNSDGRR